MKKKVLIIASYHLPNLSGITLDTQRILEVLVKRGFQCTIITSQHKSSLPINEYMNGVLVRRLPVSFFIGKWAFSPGLLYELIKYIRESDVINLHWPYTESFLVAIVAKFFRKPLIITHHVDGPDFSTMQVCIAFIARIALFISHVVSGFVANLIIPRTEDFAKHSLLLSLFRRKLKYMYPVMYKEYPTKSDLHIMKKKLGNFKYAVGFIGRFSRQKGIIYLLKSIPILMKDLGKDVVIVLAGPYRDVIGENYIDEIQELLTKYKKNIILLGAIFGKQKFAFYSNLDCLVLPSVNKTESFGQVQIEAMLSHTPVVTTDLPGVRDPVRITGMGEIVKIRDPSALAKGIIRIINARKSYLRKKTHVSKIYNPKKVFSFYKEIFLSPLHK